MAFDYKAYSGDEITAVVGSVPINEGLGPDTFISVDYDEDFFSISVGADGETTRSKTNNRSATITITLQQTSDINDLLTVLWQTDLNTPGGAPVPFLLSDSNGRSLYAAEKCWIQKPPTAEFGRDPGTREWVLRTGNLVAFYGGNSG